MTFRVGPLFSFSVQFLLLTYMPCYQWYVCGSNPNIAVGDIFFCADPGFFVSNNYMYYLDDLIFFLYYQI